MWITQPLERKNADGSPSGLWHLTANSDEGGGFAVGCDHDHASAEEAQTCEEALIKIGQATGFPHRERAPRADTSGWIVGNGSGDRWRAWDQGNPVWVDDRDQATRYARRVDAEAVHAEDEDVWSVVPYEAAA